MRLLEVDSCVVLIGEGNAIHKAALAVLVSLTVLCLIICDIWDPRDLNIEDQCAKYGRFLGFFLGWYDSVAEVIKIPIGSRNGS